MFNRILNKLPALSVGIKIFLTFFLSIVILVAAVGWLSFASSKTIIKNKVSDAALQTLIQTQEKMAMLLDKYEAITNQLVVDLKFNAPLAALLDQNINESDEFTATDLFMSHFRNLEISDNNINSINFIFLEGDRQLSIKGVYPVDVKQTSWFKKAVALKGKPLWLDTVNVGYGPVKSEEPTFAVTRLINDYSSQAPIGVVVLELKASALTNQLKAIHISDKGSLFISNASNYVIEASDMSKIATPSEVQINASEPYGTLEQAGNIVVYSKVKASEWNLVGTLPISELANQSNAIFKITLIMTLAAVVIAIIIGIYVGFRIGKPMKQLNNLMILGAQGNLMVRTSFRGRDEIGQVGFNFNYMMEQITQLVKQTAASAQEVLGNAVVLSMASSKTASSAKEISMATEAIASGSSILALEAEKGSEVTSLTQMQMKAVIEANVKMSHSAEKVQNVSEQGANYMHGLMNKTAVTEQMTRSMVSKVNELKESTVQIHRILEVLNQITKKTNILSLNASIEAARAGAAGKGFMVVADEIRQLAQQSKQSIEFVAQVTDRIQTEIEGTVTVLSKAYPLFQEQIVSVKEADQIFVNVQAQMSGFLGHLDEVTASLTILEDSQNILTEAMTNVSAVSQETSASTEQVASLSTEQAGISDSLVEMSEKMKELSEALKLTLSKFTIELLS